MTTEIENAPARTGAQTTANCLKSNISRADIQAAIDRGWCLTPLRGKIPILTKWCTKRPTVDELAAHAAGGGNLGLVTGAASGIIVLDFDGDMTQHADLLSRLPDTVTCITGSGGMHLYFRMPATPIKNSVGKLADHVDVRADNGVVVFPGSRHPETGKLYRWMDGHDPGDVEIAIAEWPQWITEALAPKKPAPTTPRPEPRPAMPTNGRQAAYIESALAGEVAAVRCAPEGGRNARLNTAALKLSALGIAEDIITAELTPAALDSGLDPREIAATIASGMKAGRQSPRELPEADEGYALAWDGKPEIAEPATATEPVAATAAHRLPATWLSDVLAPREFIFAEGAFPVDAVSLVFSQGGLGKSSFALVLAASLTTGRTLLDGWTPRERGGVLLVSAEDDVCEITRRLQRIAHVYNLGERDAEQIADGLSIVNPDPARPFFFADRNGAVIPGPALADLRAIVQADMPRMLFLDPLAALLNGLPENDNAIAQAVISMMRTVIPAGIATCILAHVSKAERADAQTPRGAGAWTDAARQAFALRGLTAAEARELKAEPSANWAALELRKSNYTAPRGPQYFQKRDGVPVVFDATGFRQREARSREVNLRGAVLQAVQEMEVTRQEARGHATTADGRKRGAEFRDIVARHACVDTVSTREITAVITSMEFTGELKTMKQDNRAILIAATQTGTVE